MLRHHALRGQRRGIDAAQRDFRLRIALGAGGLQHPPLQQRAEFSQIPVADLADHPRRQVQRGHRLRQPCRQKLRQDGSRLRLRPRPLARQQQRRRVALRQQVERQRRALPPITGGLQDRRPREAAMGEQQRLPERRLAGLGDAVERQPGERPHQIEHGAIEGERHQPRPDRRQRQAEALRQVMREAGRAHLRDGQPAGRQHQRFRGEGAAVRGDPKAVAAGDLGDAMVAAQIDAGRLAFRHQHGHDLPRRAVAEQLPQRLFVEGDAMLLHQRDKVMLGVARQRRAREMRIGREEALRRAARIGEVAAPAAADEDLLPRLLGVVEQQHAAPALPRAHRAEQPRRAGAEHHHIEIRHAGQAAAASPAMSRPTASATRMPSTPAEKMPPA